MVTPAHALVDDPLPPEDGQFALDSVAKSTLGGTIAEERGVVTDHLFEEECDLFGQAQVVGRLTLDFGFGGALFQIDPQRLGGFLGKASFSP